MPNLPPGPTPAPASPAPVLPTSRRRGRWLLYGCGGLLAFLLIIIAAVLITVWWIQRPIKPVVLSPQEKSRVEAKLQELESSKPPPPPNVRPAQPAPLVEAPGSRNVELPPAVVPPERADRTYTPGGKVLKLTEREINGLLNANTDLGKSVRLEFDRDAINAYLAVRIPDDFPVGGGKMFRARGRFRVSLGNGGEPYAILEDVTVFGLSLPKTWLGGIKGENLLGAAVGESRNNAVLRGIKSLRVEPGALVLEVQD